MATLFKDFIENNVLTADDVDTYLMKQAVVQVDTYADLASLDAGVKAAYNLADGQVYIYSGSGWGAVGTFVGTSAPANPATGALWYNPSDAGTWVTGSSTVGGTGWALGNGTLSCLYSQFGKTVNARWSFTLGSTSTAGGSGLTFSLPVNSTGAGFVGSAICYDSSAAARYSAAALIFSTTVTPFALPAAAAGADRVISTSVPFTWTTSDTVTVSATYEAA